MITDALLEKGADPNLLDKQGRTPMHHASYWGHLFVLKSLLDKGGTVNVAVSGGGSDSSGSGCSRGVCFI